MSDTEPRRPCPGPLYGPSGTAGLPCLPAVSSGMDAAIRASMAAVVLVVAGIAAYISYWHARAVVRQYGESGVTALLEPGTIDGLVYASSMVILYAPLPENRKSPLPRAAAPDPQQAAIDAAARRAAESALAVRTRQRYDLVRSLKARGKGIKPIKRETGLAKEAVRRFCYAETADELLAKVKDGRPSTLGEHKPYLHQRWNEGCANTSLDKLTSGVTRTSQL